MFTSRVFRVCVPSDPGGPDQGVSNLASHPRDPGSEVAGLTNMTKQRML